MLQNYNLLKVASVFFDDPLKRFGLLEISEQINLAHTSVKKYLQELQELDVIFFENAEFGKRKAPLFKAQYRSKQFLFYKKMYNLFLLYESGIIAYLEKTLQPNAIVLFGSFARGEDIKDSDIDLFIECKKRDLDLKDFQLPRKIELHFKEKFKSYSNDLKNNIQNGIVLAGFLDGYGKNSNNDG